MRRSSLLPLLLFVACGESGTGEESVRFTLAFEVNAEGRSFETRSGWQVELEEAHLAVGPLALFSNAAPSASLLDRLRELVIPVAYAHAGFDEYDGGTVRGELLATVVLDLSREGPQGRVELDGVAGPVRSATLELAPAGDAVLHGAQAWVRGTATRGGESIPFAGGLHLPNDAKSRRVAGIPAELELAEGETVVVTVHPERWFAEADFASLPEAADGGAREITPGGQVHAAWFLGARGFGAFTID
jgi:hypothetical protein